MVNLATRDFREILVINNHINACRSLEEFSHTAMTCMRRLLNAETSVFFRLSDTSGNPEIDQGIAHGPDKSILNDYHKHFKKQDPFLSKALDKNTVRRNPVIVSNRMVDYRVFERTEFYNDFLRPISVYSILGVTLSASSKPLGLMAVHRPKKAPHFNRTDQTKAQMVVPGLSAALQRIMTLDRLDERNWLFETVASELSPAGSVALDRSLTPVFCNKQARKLLATLPGANLNQEGIPGILIQACKTLMAEPAQSGTSPAIRVALESQGKHPLWARVRRIISGKRGPCFLIYLEQGQSNPVADHKLDQLGLTQREIDIVHLVHTGLTSNRIAGKLCISERTVENHLRSIYSKLGVHNRTSMIYHLFADD